MPSAICAVFLGSLLAGTSGCTAPNPGYLLPGPETDASDSTGDVGIPAPDLPLSVDTDIVVPDRAPGVPPTADVAAPDRTPSLPDESPAVDAFTPSARDAGIDAIATADAAQKGLAGLVAYWRFDEAMGTVTADATGNGHTGTLRNAVARVASGFPASTFANTGCVELDGVDDFIEIAVGNNLPATNATKSISFWFYLKVSSVNKMTMIALTNPPLLTSIQIGLTQGRVAAWEWNGSPIVHTAAAVTLDWHHVAYTYEGTKHTLYVDGASVDSMSQAAIPGPITIARLGTFESPKEQFAGRLDDVRIYDRVLSASEVKDLATGK